MESWFPRRDALGNVERTVSADTFVPRDVDNTFSVKSSFLHDDQPEEIRDINKDDFATCLSERIKSSDTLPAAPSSDAIKVKIGGSRIQNLRASQLLQKSQEVMDYRFRVSSSWWLSLAF